MDSISKIVDMLTCKLCLTSNVSKKAEELIRLLELKTTGSTLAISEICRAIICLNLAATSLGVYCDKANAIKLSGVKKTVYLNSYHTVKKLLHLDEQVYIKDLCVRLNVEEASVLASRLMDSILAEKPPPDPSHPMYPTFAVFAACRHLRLKVDKNTLVEMSCLKRSAFDYLSTEFSQVVERILPASNKTAKKRSHVFTEVIQNSIKASQKTLAAEIKGDSDVETEPAEEYEAWKKRILQGSSGDQL